MGDCSINSGVLGIVIDEIIFYISFRCVVGLGVLNSGSRGKERGVEKL